MAFHENFEGLALKARVDAISIMKERARRELSLPDSEMVIRPLRPNDLGNLGGTWETIGVGLTLTALHNATLGPDRFASIYGLFMQPSMQDDSASESLIAGTTEYAIQKDSRGEDIQRLRISRNQSVTREWTINMIPGWKNKTGFADDPIIVGPNQNITTEFCAITSSSTLDQDSYAFLGDVVERRGITINP